MDVSGSVLRVTAGIGEANRITVSAGTSTFTIADAGVPALAGGLGCTGIGTVTCATTGVSSVMIDAGDGNDTVTLTGLTKPATVVDGPGDDMVTGGSAGDTFIASPGADTLAGGGGTDTVDYSARTAPLSVRLDDVAGDGEAGEGDDVRSDVETVLGGAGADTLVGAAGPQTLRGNGGDDLLDGRGGADVLAGGSGWDTADYSSRTAAVTVTLDGVANDGETGELDNAGTDVDAVLGGEGADTITGHGGANELRGNGGDDVLNGAGGDDVLRGGAGADRLDGGANDDTLDGGTGTDSLTGGTGTDLADWSARTAPIHADLNGTTGFGEDGENDTVAADVEGAAGGSGDDVLTGDANANVLIGNGGDDVLDGRLGADDISGGTGTDTVSYASRTSGVTLKLDNAANDGAGGEADNVRADVEVLGGSTGSDVIAGDDDPNVITGNGGNDTVTGNGGDDVITLGAGNDTVSGGSGADTITTGDGTDTVGGGAGDDVVDGGDGGGKLSGDDGNDTITGGTGAETLNGGAGDDALTAGDGNDRLYGNDGNDTLDAGGGDDAGDGGTGDDRITAGDGNDTLSGGDGIDWVDGGAGNDRLSGNDGNDNLDGGSGDDNLDGGAGDDAETAGDGNDTLAGGAGADVLGGGVGDDKLSGNDDADTLDGGAGNDGLWGGSGDDTLTDGEGDNRLYGEDGADRLTAGPGDDSLSGGNDPDFLDAGAGDDQVNGDAGDDRLQGGDGADKLWGSGGDDVLDGGLGPDQMDGADGTDTVDYGARTAGVVVTNDGKADDGQRDEGDNVAGTIDNAIGGSGDDRITFATAWPHRLDGGDGNDLLRGGAREDTLTGGRGADLLFGEGGRDAYDGGAGADHLSAADGTGEQLLCGAGKDVAVLDKADSPAGCEKRTLRAVTVASPAVPKPAPAPARAPSGGSAGGKTVVAPRGLIGVKRVATRGRFVTVPGAGGVRLDRRILQDVAWILRHYRVRITAGFARTGHALHGEHPIGLAVDLVPGAGGSWDDVDRLARWAEPRQNYPRAPFRWVGYNGDPNHGRGNHLHLSWMHAATSPGRPAAWVVTMRFRSPGGSGTRRPSRPVVTRGSGALVRWARSNASLGRRPSIRSGLHAIARCSGVGPLRATLMAASRAFGLGRWQVLAGLTETESAFGCNMGPSSAGAIGWTQFMPATWRAYDMDADGDGRADPYNSVDAVFSTARYLRASGAPGSWRRALHTYNHDWSYVNIVLARAKKY